MATQKLSPKLLQNLPYFTSRHLNSASAVTSSSSSISAISPLNLAEKTNSTVKQPPPTTSSSIINLDDFKELFSSISTSKLLRSSATLHVAAIEPVVDMGTWVMNSRLMDTVVLREIILGTIKHTFYEHFCAGQDLEEVGRTVVGLSEAGLKAMLDYGLEHAEEIESCDRNMEEFISTVESTKSLPSSSVSSVVVKITAICPPSLLRRVSDLLRWEYYKEPCIKYPWKLNSLPIFSNSSPFFHTQTKPNPLTLQEERDIQLAHQRLLNICEKCIENNVPIVIDAEDTSIQPAIDYFSYSSAILYNKNDNPIVFGTIQAYLKDTKERLLRAEKAAEKLGVSMGVKLVRGAYMSSEREVAASLGFESPIHSSIQQTHECYNDCASFLLEKIAKGSGAVVLATHNVESGKLAAAKAQDLGIGKENQKLQFAQLYGMAESLSFGLRNAGFQVSKYLPFGPVEQIMPYLLRRAEENRGLLSTSAIDRQLMRRELLRRLKATVL